MRSNQLWGCPPKTRAKLEILRGYLGSWFGILANAGFRHVFYIDGFCGPGEYLEGEEGSPVIAAQIASKTSEKYPGFTATLIFVDTEPKALERLRENEHIVTPHPNVTISIRDGAFADNLEPIVDELQRSPTSPTFSFIDPFGFSHSPFDSITRLMHNDRSEVFVNLMCGFMNRFKQHPDSQVRDRIKAMVGTGELDEIISAVDPINRLCSTYERNLRRVGDYVLKFMVRDEGNIRDNAFFYCGRHATGFEKIKEAMWRIDPVNGSAFSTHERAHPQSDMFRESANTSELSSLLMTRFAGQENVSVKEIFDWVIQETDRFLPRHARQELERMADARLIKGIRDPNGRKRRKSTWPIRLFLDFAMK